MKRILTLAFFLVLVQIAQGQTILNGGFEDNTFSPMCAFHMTNSTYSAQISNIVAYGNADRNDIIRDGSCPQGPPNSGDWNGTVAYFNSFGGVDGHMSISFELSASVTSGNQYTLTYYDKAKITDPNFFIIGTVSVGISQTPTSNGTNIGTSIAVQDVWTQRSFTFTAPFSGTAYITATVLSHNEVGKVAWVHLDDFQVALVLPVELTDFQVLEKNNAAELRWRTASETNNEGFEIQRSSDGMNWKKIGFVAGQGFSSQAHDYSLTDELPMPGMNYYRLRQIDWDGQSEFSHIVSVQMENDWQVKAFPNPNNGSFTLDIQNPSDLPIQARLVDMLGRTAWETTMLNSPSAAIDATTASNISAGIYTLIVKQGNKSAQVLMEILDR